MNDALNQSNTGTVIPRLSLMMFLQFFTWGTWFATLGAAMDTAKLGPFIAGAYITAPIAAIIAPLFLGLIADRFFSSERVFGVLMLIGAGIMFFIPGVADSAKENATAAYSQLEASGLSGDSLTEAFGESQIKDNSSGNLLFWMILAHMLCFMPTIGLGNTVAFANIPNQDKFPAVRVWGTIGWIAAGLLVGFSGWSQSFFIFQLCAISSLVLGLFCFFLPHTPPPLKGKPVDMRSLLMLDALGLLAKPNFLVFALASTAICIPLAWYHGSSSQFLSTAGFRAEAATLTLGQMWEIVFMLLIPFFFRKMGVKMMLLVGMAAWALRYVLYAFGAPSQVTWMFLAAISLHGICYDFFFVTGFMYTDKKAPKEIRGQAQSLLVFLTQGIGMWLGFYLMGKFAVTSTESRAFGDALAAARGESKIGFGETFLNMFSRSYPDGLDTTNLAATMDQWKSFWLIPAGIALVVGVVFALTFWDRMSDEEREQMAEEMH
ncbi:MAG: MFS transporter [Pirellulaceae bacterium]